MVFVLACICFGYYTVKTRIMADTIPPLITCDQGVLSVSVEDEESELFEGVKAKDDKDGDLTGAVRIKSMSHFIGKGKRTVTYVVFDKANQAGTLERMVEYTDYVSPRIYLKKPLRYTTASYDKVSLDENMTAEDCLDGNLTKQIQIIYDDDYYSGMPGSYPVTAQVGNSAGDMCTLPLDVVVTSAEDRGERNKAYPLLSDYIVYTHVGEKIDPMAYVIGLEKNRMEYTYEEDADIIGGTKEQIAVTSNVDYSKSGVYTVEYAYTASGAPEAVTTLYVVVEGEQDGE